MTPVTQALLGLRPGVRWGGANSTPTEMARCAQLPCATLPHVVGPAWALSQSRVARARGPSWGPRPSGYSSRRCANSGSLYPLPEAPHSPGSRAGPGAAAPCGHALFTRASALALPLVAVSACALPTTRSDSAKNNKSPPPAARRRLPSTDTASGIARRSASPPRPRDGHAPSDHAPVAHASSRTKTTPLSGRASAPRP